MKYIAAAFCFLLWISVSAIAIITIIGLLILALADENVSEWWFKNIPQSILETFKK